MSAAFRAIKTFAGFLVRWMRRAPSAVKQLERDADAEAVRARPRSPKTSEVRR